MSKNNIIDLYCFGNEIGKIGFDENQKKSFFQYNPVFLKSGSLLNLFPLIFKKTPIIQVFNQFNNDTFRGLPPMIADSLPDMFGNIIFKTWLEATQKDFKKISVLEQLAYVSNRGMGALEYQPSKKNPEGTTINIQEIKDVLKKVLDNKKKNVAPHLDSASLLNIFKIGTSAGGARPKILISEHKKTGEITSGDLVYSDDFAHYLVKLNLDDDATFNREKIEFCYYQTAIDLGITMMPSKLIDEKHFATLRFDRQNGQKKHVLTATGMTGWDFNDPSVSSYENVFELAIFLKLSQKDIEELYKRMIFNLVFSNTDDHLKNHSFIYDEIYDQWALSPAYDVTYSLNPFMNYKKVSRALSINNKRMNIELVDLLQIADKYTIKNPKSIIEKIEKGIPIWLQKASDLDISEREIEAISKDFKTFLI
jgi:serine/threonine-protein kinase HipA